MKTYKFFKPLYFLTLLLFVQCTSETNEIDSSDNPTAHISSKRASSVDLNKVVSNFLQKNHAIIANNTNVTTPPPCYDTKIDCSQSNTTALTYDIEGDGKVYPPMTLPFECDIRVQMNIDFCYINGRFMLLFTDVTPILLLQPTSAECDNWLQEYGALSNADKENVIRQLFHHLERQFEAIVMDDFIRANNPNGFLDCRYDDVGACIGPFLPVEAHYVKGSCTKFCWVYDPNTCGEWLPWCLKEVRCYQDGCCRIETKYCYDRENDEVIVCQGPAIFLVEGCTIPVTDNCLYDSPIPCNTVPRCEP